MAALEVVSQVGGEDKLHLVGRRAIGAKARAPRLFVPRLVFFASSAAAGDAFLVVMAAAAVAGAELP